MRQHSWFAGVIILAFVGVLYLSSHPRGEPKGDERAIPVTSTTYTGVRDHDDVPQDDLSITAPPGGGTLGLSLYAGGEPYQTREQSASAAAAGWVIHRTVHRKILDYDLDVGAWIGGRIGHPSDRDPSSAGADIGIRYSPVRVLYGVLAPDVLVSTRQAGIGISAWPPQKSVAERWQHFGAGVGYMADYHTGNRGWMFYGSLSTRF